MLCVNTYTKDYVNSCRSKIEAQLAAYRVLAGAAREKAGDSSASAATFEPLFFNNLVLVLDRLFVHRARGLEGKGDQIRSGEIRLAASARRRNPAKRLRSGFRPIVERLLCARFAEGWDEALYGGDGSRAEHPFS
jgi:hypothetical protein